VPRATGRWRAPTIGRLTGRRRSGPLATVGRVRLPRRATLHTAGSRQTAPVRLVLLAVLVGAALTGCGRTGAQWHAGTGAATGPSAPAGGPVPGSSAAPARAFPVGVRGLALSRGADRPLRTVVWYPAVRAGTGAAVAAGRFPVLLFSHGLGADPEDYAPGTSRLAAAGFVVVAPAYPYTDARAQPVNPVDVVNQPADASAVLDAVLALDSGADALAGHLATGAVAALGHSAGGYTTAALFGIDRDPRLVAGVILSGGAIGGFRGAPAPLLFVHGDRDTVVDYATGRSAYQQVAWPKAFLTLPGAGHADYLRPGSPAFAPVLATVTDFLRWRLYGDAAARARLPGDATVRGVSRWEAAL
jgi:fermentation-respiration switch protein FrsA (DUF1100 family)